MVCSALLFFETICSGHPLTEVNTVFENISIGYLTSFITYYLTVEVPDKRKKIRKKDQLKALIKNTTAKLFYAYDCEYIALSRYLNEDNSLSPELAQKMFLSRTQYINNCIGMLNDAFHEFCISYSSLQEEISEEFVVSIERLNLNYLYCNIMHRYHHFHTTIVDESYVLKKEVLLDEIRLNNNIIDFCIAFHTIEKMFDLPYNLSLFNTSFSLIED